MLNSETPLAEVEGHAPHRVSRVQFHPSGRYLGTCCFDNSWRLWDLTKCEEVLHQEGHCKPVYCMSFQCDGSVVATGLVNNCVTDSERFYQWLIFHIFSVDWMLSDEYGI